MILLEILRYNSCVLCALKVPEMKKTFVLSALERSLFLAKSFSISQAVKLYHSQAKHGKGCIQACQRILRNAKTILLGKPQCL